MISTRGLILVTLLWALPGADAETYRYDAAGRLIEVVYDDGSGLQYTYDANGNILQTEVQERPEVVFANGFE